MGYPLLWRARGRSTAAEDRIVRFRRLLEAALHVPRYRAPLWSAGLQTSQSIRAVTEVHEILNRFPPISREEYRRERASLENPRGAGARLQRLVSPLKGPSRIALLAAGFRADPALREFWSGEGSDWMMPVEQYQPDILAAPAPLLLSLAQAQKLGSLAFGPVPHAIIAFTGIQHGELTESGRKLLWRAFHAPIFEHYMGPDGMVIARECEAHHGLHIAPESAVVETCEDHELTLTSLTDLRHPAIRLRTGFACSIDPTPCDCGKVEPRLIAALDGVRIPPARSIPAIAGGQVGQTSLAG